MTLTPPPERALANRDRMLSRILADELAVATAAEGARRSRWLAPVSALAAAAVVAATAVGVSALRSNVGAQPAPAAGEAVRAGSSAATHFESSTPTGAVTPSATGPVTPAIVTGPLTPAETRAITQACTRTFGITARSTAHERYVEVGGAFPSRILTIVVVARDGSTWGCSAPDTNADSVSGGHLGSKARPNRTPYGISTGTAATVGGAPGRPDFIESAGWAVVPPGAASVRARWKVDGVGRGWWTTVPVDGFAFVVAHLDAQVSVGDVLATEAQVLNAAGRVLDRSSDDRMKVVARNGHVVVETTP